MSNESCRDFSLYQYLALQTVAWRIGGAIQRVLPTERLYLLSLGSQQGNSHVHWHLAPLPPGVPYDQQQFTALMPDRVGLLNVSDEEQALLASRIATQLKTRPTVGNRPTVHVVAGLPASGKTTVAIQVAADHGGVRFSLDEWMLRLHGLRFDDEQYIERLPACLDLILDVAGQARAAGSDVVLDWNHWSPEKRARSAIWARRQSAGYVVHHVATPLDEAKSQLARRNSAGDAHSHVTDPSALDHARSYFVPPAASEGHQIRVHDPLRE